nr:MAG TPA: Short C-terminal domain [Caudoviricetes sp.]
MGDIYRPVLGCWCIDQGVHSMNVSPLAMDGDKTVGQVCMMEIDGLYKKGVISETERDALMDRVFMAVDDVCKRIMIRKVSE